MNKPVVLIIMDGWGLAPAGPGNAVTQAKTPNIDRFWAAYPHTQLKASGEAVGLPRGEDGNSETGHMNLGAGRVILQDLPRINIAIADGSFFKIPAFGEAITHLKQNHSRLHLLGLIGAGGVHSSLEHLLALIRFAEKEQVEKVFLHLFTDGRDSPPSSALTYLNRVESELKKTNSGQIATLCGRYWAMDRDHRWDRTQKAYDLLTLGQGTTAKSASAAIKASYAAGKTDEFLEPVVLNKEGLINDNDAVIFFNFRIDRPRQLTKAFVLPDFESLKPKKAAFDPYAERYGLRLYKLPKGRNVFQRQKIIKNLFFVTMTEYEKSLPVQAAFPPKQINMPLARILAEKGLRQFHLAETEKYPHVTVFFNGGREEAFPGEDRMEIPSPDVDFYDKQPAMSAHKVTEILLNRLETKIYDFILVNFANPDMVGHTGVLPAAIKACEITDECVGKIVNRTLALGGATIITADHGNVEEMINLRTNQVDTKHSINPVPVIIASQAVNHQGRTLNQGILADIAPTILNLLDIEKPSMMTGKNLLENG